MPKTIAQAALDVLANLFAQDERCLFWIQKAFSNEIADFTTGNDEFVVICKDGGKYVLATRLVFKTEEEAKKYANTCDKSRAALAVPGRWRQLRFEIR